MRNFLYILSFVSFFLGILPVSSARADIMITPIYVIFSDRDRSAEVTLLNTTNNTNIYRLEWSFTRQKEDGSYEKLSTVPEGQIDPASFMRFSPRQVTLLPQSKQKIRIQLQKPADLPDGEYRAHLNFKRLPNDDNVDNTGTTGAPQKGMSMEFKISLGVSMPVVVRQGEYDARAEVVDARFVRRKNTMTGEMREPELMVKIARTGKHGTYGRLRVFWNNGGREEQVGVLNNFSVYADNSARVGYVQLNKASIPSGELRLVYEGDGPQRGQILAEQKIAIGR